MKRKVFCALLALCVLISTVGWSALPALAETDETGGATHKHDYVLSPTRLSIGTGHFYLNEDWLLKGAQTIRVTGNATICLNGHKIDANGKSLQIIVLAGAKLTICDCDHTMREGHLDANGLWREGKAAVGEADMPLYGGVITGSSSQLQLVSSYGEFYLESGNIAGNTIANNTAAILRTQNQGKVVVNGGTCVGNLASIMKIDSDSSGKTEAGCGEINGGKITKNRASAAIVSNYGTLTVTGGEITDNQSDSGAGAIQNIKNKNTKNATLQLSGQPTIKDNTSKDGHNNIFLENKPIEITGLLQSSAPIGIGMANPGTFTNGWQTQMSDQTPSKYFFADQTGYWVSEENGEAVLTNQKPEVKAPVITKQPEGLNLKYGEGGTLSVEASAEAGATVSYQWHQATDATSTENGTVIDGATSATLTIAKDAQPGTSYYYCVVIASRDGVSKTATSNTATVTVQKPEVKAPVITKQPEGLNLKYGEGGTLSVEASAEADATVSYQWYQAKDGTSTENSTAIDGATNATVTIVRDAQPGTNYYYCVVTASRDGVDAKTASRIVAVTVKKDEEKPVNPPASSNRPSTQKPGELVINPDGSVTTMVTKPNGTVVVTTKYPNGDRLVLTTETSGMISVLLEGDESRLIILPIKSPKAETVAMVTDASGVTRLEPFAVPTQQGLALKVHNGDAIEIIQKHTVFSDVTATHWAYEPVTFAAARGFLVGIDATHFAPNMQTSRAMIWSILARMDNACLEESTPWYASSQHWAVSGGISDGTDPNATITREQLAAMLYRYAGSPAVRGNVESFSDAQQVSAWAEDALIWAVHEGIIAGTTTDTLTPQGTATRAQTAAMLERFIAWQLGVK